MSDRTQYGVWARVVKGSTVLLSTEKLVWLEINFMSQREEGCTLSANSLAVRLGTGVRHIYRARSFLRACHLVRCLGPEGTARQWWTQLDEEYTPTSHDVAQEVFKGLSERLDSYIQFIRDTQTGKVPLP